MLDETVLMDNFISFNCKLTEMMEKHVHKSIEDLFNNFAGTLAKTKSSNLQIEFILSTNTETELMKLL